MIRLDLSALQKSGSRSPVNLYWERWHEQLPSGLLTINKKQPQKVSLDLSHVKELVEARSKVDESKDDNNGNGPYNELDNHDQGFKSEGSVEQVPGMYGDQVYLFNLNIYVDLT